MIEKVGAWGLKVAELWVRSKKKAKNGEKLKNGGVQPSLDVENHVESGEMKDIPDMLAHVDEFEPVSTLA